MLEITTAWLEQYLSALVLLNLMLGQPAATTPLRKPVQESIARTLNEIARGLYRPDRHFAQGRARPPLAQERRELVAAENYTVILLNASTAESDFASVQTGGVLFEDPAWAVFAAEGSAQGRMLGVPLAADDAELSARLPHLETAIREKKYAPEKFFAPVTGFVNPPVASFSLVQVTGSQLTALRKQGIQSFGKPSPKFYVLFAPAAGNP